MSSRLLFIYRLLWTYGFYTLIWESLPVYTFDQNAGTPTSIYLSTYSTPNLQHGYELSIKNNLSQVEFNG